MADIENHNTKVSRREAFGLSSAALTAAAALTVAGARNAHAQQLAAHNAPNEIDPGPQNLPLAKENPDSEWAPLTDHGTVPPFKYSFALVPTPQGLGRRRPKGAGRTRKDPVQNLVLRPSV